MELFDKLCEFESLVACVNSSVTFGVELSAVVVVEAAGILV